MTSNTNLTEHSSQAIFCVCAVGRHVTHISEITGPSGNVKDRFHSTGIVPKFGERLKAAGIPLGLKLLDHSVEV